MIKKKISVIIPFFNLDLNGFKRTLTSVSFQTLSREAYEVIVVDDCSEITYSTKLQELADYYAIDKVLSLTKNSGLSSARGEGVKISNGEFVFFINGNDVISSDALESLYSEHLISGANIVSSEVTRIFWSDNHNLKLGSFKESIPGNYQERLKFYLEAKYSSSMCGRLIKKSLLENDLFFHERVYYGDIITFSHLIFKKDVSFSKVNKECYFYSASNSSISSNVTFEHVHSYAVVFNHLLNKIAEAKMTELLMPSLGIGISKYFSYFLRRIIYQSTVKCDEELIEQFFALAEHFKSHSVEFSKEFIELTEKFRESKLIPAKDVDGSFLSLESIGKRVSFQECSDFCQRSVAKNVFVCEVNYHVENAVATIRMAVSLGYRLSDFLILDNSRLNVGGRRAFDSSSLTKDELEIYLVNFKKEIETDAFIFAKTVFLFNDYNNISRLAINFRRFYGGVNCSIVEGLSDFQRSDFDLGNLLPYRNSEIILLAGNYDKEFFKDRKIYMFGNSKIKSLQVEDVVFPEEFKVVLNVNFSYGVLESKRSLFWSEFCKAQQCLGFSFEVTKHPADRSSDDQIPRSKKKQNELIRESSVFVSRFATGILEALSLGKPVIYFNPHGEKVPKFNNPMGAFLIARNAEELVSCLKKVRSEIEGGVDFRKRASLFLDEHISDCNDVTRVLSLLNKDFGVRSVRVALLKNEISFSENKDNFCIEVPFSHITAEVVANLVISSGSHVWLGFFEGESVSIKVVDSKILFSNDLSCTQEDGWRRVSLAEALVFIDKVFGGNNVKYFSREIRPSLIKNLETELLKSASIKKAIKYFILKKIRLIIFLSIRFFGLFKMEKKVIKFTSKELAKYK